MDSNRNLIHNDIVTEKVRSTQFWKRVLIIYALVEIFLIVAGNWVTRMRCPPCVLPAPFYVLVWTESLLVTGLLWYLLNKFYHLRLWKQVALNAVVFVAWYFIWIGGRYAVFHSGMPWLIGAKTTIHDFTGMVYGSWTDIGKYVVIVSAFYVAKFYFVYRRAERQRLQLAVINKDMQLNLLKEQLSPHFYFNTLNNLYGLARNNSPKLPAALQQLYDIMRYVIEDCNRPQVLLAQEIGFLQSYIALEKLRYEQHTVIDITVSGNPGKLTIVPLMLIQFVENAFKHGMKEKSADNWMHVHLAVSGGLMEFSVKNSYYETANTGGIGLDSVRRLLHLQYEDRYDLRISHEDNHFYIHLKLNIL